MPLDSIVEIPGIRMRNSKPGYVCIKDGGRGYIILETSLYPVDHDHYAQYSGHTYLTVKRAEELGRALLKIAKKKAR